LKLNLKQISELIPDSKILNSDSPEKIEFDSVKKLTEADESSISLFSAKTHQKEFKETKAKVVIINEEVISLVSIPALLVSNVDIALGKVLDLFHPPKKPAGIRGEFLVIHPSSKIGENVDIGNFVSIGENSFIGKNSILEDGVKIGKNVIISENARIGLNTVFHENVVVGKNFVVFGNSTFGGDGFKFVTIDKIHHKIPQIAKVIIGDDVEIGSNCAVDKGGIEDTIIGDGCKFDNMVHVGHNVKIGKNVIIAGQSGVAGSTIIGDDCLIGGACAISDHLVVPPNTIIAGGTGLRTSPKEANVYIGWDWGMNYAEYQKARVNIKHLVGFHKVISRIKELEKKLGIKEE
jgi:UDP-3-O-[3-hydroxymyristoyl] glucosamine N-acyltransferase